MVKQKDFNYDLDKYLEKKRSSEPKNPIFKKKSKKKLKIKTSTEEMPDISDSTKVHIIEKENKARKKFLEYKEKILALLKKEEEEIEQVNVDENGNLSEDEALEEVEEIIEKDSEEQISIVEKFKSFFINLFGTQPEVDEEQFEQDKIEPYYDEESKEAIEEEFEEEELQEELEERKKFSTWLKNIAQKFGMTQTDEEYSEEELENMEQDEPKSIRKIVLYKAKLDNDVKLALKIADKYLKKLPSTAKDDFEKSGDKQNFDDALKRLKLK